MSRTWEISDRNNILRAADTAEMSSGGESMESSFFDYLTYGTVGAAASAFVGIANTFHALGETLGVASGDRLDTYEILREFGGTDTADFYSRHSTGIDAVGLVAGSIVPGLGAIRALRAAQTRGLISGPVQTATGLKNADLVLGSKRVESAKQAVLRAGATGEASLRNPAMYRAYATGFKQQMLESFAFEAGMLATMNQHSTLNPDDLSYLESFWSAGKAGVPFAVAGGVIGAGIDVLRIRGAVKKVLADETARTSQLRLPDLGDMTGMPAGDKLLILAESAQKHGMLKAGVKDTDFFAQGAFTKGRKLLQNAFIEVLGEVNVAGNEGRLLLNELVNNSTSDQLPEIARILAGMTRLENVSVGQVQEMRNLYDRSRAPMRVHTVESTGDFGELVAQVTGSQKQQLSDIGKIFGDKFVDEFLPAGQATLDATVNITRSMLRKFSSRTPQGGAVSEVLKGEGKLSNLQLSVTLVKGPSGEVVPYVRPFTILGEEEMRVGWELQSAFDKSLGAIPATFEQYARQVHLHEVAHIKNNGAQLTNWVNKNISKVVDKEKRTVLEELLALNFLGSSARWDSNMYNGIAELPDFAFVSPEARTALLREVTKIGELAVKQPQTAARRLSQLIMDENGQISDSLRMNGEVLSAGNPIKDYLLSTPELLADAGAALTNERTRELASKLAPNFAKRFNKDGGFAKAWDDTKAFYNMRTKETLSSALPGIADVGHKAMKIVQRKLDTVLEVPALKRSFVRDIAAFSSETLRKLGLEKKVDKAGDAKYFARGKLDYLEYDAQWVMGSRVAVEQLTQKNGDVIVNATDLPVLERLVTYDPTSVDATALAKAVDEGKLFMLAEDGSKRQIDLTSLRTQLVQTKKELRTVLAATGHNENEIAKILNIDASNAIGDFAENGWLLMRDKDYLRPELVMAKYKPMTMSDAYASTKSMAAVQERAQMRDHARLQASSEILGDMYLTLPELPVELIGAISPLETRATLVNNTRTIFGSIRESAQFIGKLLSNNIQKKRQGVMEDFAQYMNTFNRADSPALRMELAEVDNLIRREWYYSIKSPKENLIVRKHALAEIAESLAIATGEKITVADVLGLARQGDPRILSEIQGVVGAGDSWAPSAVKVSKEVGDFFDLHVRRNRSYVGKKQLIASARGREAVLDQEVLYAPPRDLSREKYFAFVAPKGFKEGTDSRKFMIFARSESEYNAKVQIIQEKYPDQYHVYTRKEAEQFKKAMGEYDKGMIFDDMHFDASLKRRGDASELMPNLDIETSGTLDRYQSWHVHQEEYLLRAGVELHYGQQVQALRGLDQVVSNVQKSSFNKKFKPHESIYKDTMALMLDQRAYNGPIEDMYVRLNDYIGEKGSQLVDSALNVFRTASDAPITQEQLNTFSRQLEKNGYQPPMRELFETIVTSPDAQVSRALQSSVRILNNLASALMLRLDMAHSIVQMISTPILGLPVLIEAKQALRGTRAGVDLDNLTSVVNPANGLREPSATKLMFNASKKFWSDDGKVFMSQLRERGIVSDYLRQYLEVMDFSQLNGRHQMKIVNDKIDSLAKFGSKWSGFTFAEEFTRFQIAHSVWEIGMLRGIPEKELWTSVSSAVDKVHGIYMGHQRPQLFQGVLGQAIGLYQTYFFNFAQNALKWVGDGNRKEAIALGVLQSSIFGMQSWPGFGTMNRWIGEANRENTDLYSITGANEPGALGAYAMFGLGSHAFGVPVDFYTRGDLAIRNTTIVANPLNPMEIPAVNLVAKATANMLNVGTMMLDGTTPATEALLHGIAHNGMNRPLQGIGTILRNRVTSGYGQVYFDNANYVDYDTANEINWGSMFARAIGTRPLNESIIMNHYFRQRGYDAQVRKDISELGRSLQLSFSADSFDAEKVGDFASQYVRRGGDIQNFNAYVTRQFQASNQPAMQEFRAETKKDSTLRRAMRQMEIERSETPPWSGEPIRWDTGTEE